MPVVPASPALPPQNDDWAMTAGTRTAGERMSRAAGYGLAGAGTGPLETLGAAKINLHLHVTGRRDDGYHLLDSLVVFADIGDRVVVDPWPLPAGAETVFRLTGRFAADLACTMPADNLAMRAAAALAGRVNRPLPRMIALDKRLPVASGIGGGSADAAAVLRLLSGAWGVPRPVVMDVAGQLGADVAMCVAACPARIAGVGEVVTPLGHPTARLLGGMGLVLANPLMPLSTPAVFKARAASGAVASAPASLPDAGDLPQLLAALADATNDLAPPARVLLPVIADVETALAALPGACFTRMSGSGATCFALFASPDAAKAASVRLAAARPSWWVAAGRVLAVAPEIRETPSASS